MSCKFNSELLVAAFGQNIHKEFPPCVFGFSPGEFPFPRYFPGGESLFLLRISQFPKRETGPALQFLRGRNAGLQDLFFVSNGRKRYPIMTLIVSFDAEEELVQFLEQSLWQFLRKSIPKLNGVLFSERKLARWTKLIS